MKTSNLLKEILDELNFRKAINPIVIEIAEISSITDYMVIASMDSDRGVKALADYVNEKLKKDFKIKTLIDGINTIYAGNMYYNPSVITISQGDSVRFINEGGFHDVYTTSGPVKLSLGPCSGPCTIGTLVFDVSGRYDYICSIGSHAQQGMTGTIIVNPK